MAKKSSKSNRELAVDWLTDELPIVLMQTGYRMRALKLRFNGADWFAVLEVKFDGECFVGFVGGATIPSVAKKLLEAFREDSMKWKIDQYAKED